MTFPTRSRSSQRRATHGCVHWTAMSTTRAVTSQFDLRLPSPVDELQDDLLATFGIRLFLKRDDLIHPEIPGNKWRKLKHNLLAATDLGHNTLLTFGGAYSNHIRATAAAGYYFGFSTFGVIPEGGSNELGAQGCVEIPREIDFDFDVICCPCGTGGTLAGMAAGLRVRQRAIGFSVLKGGQFLAAEVDRLQRRAFASSYDNWTIEYDFHCGGFAKKSPELQAFIDAFKARHGLVLDWVYVAKMLYGIFALTERGELERGTRVV